MHFRILSMIATSDLLTVLAYTNFVFGWGSAPDPAGEAYSAPPDPLAGLRGLTSKGRGRKEKIYGRGEQRQGNGGEGRKVETSIPAYIRG